MMHFLFQLVKDVAALLCLALILLLVLIWLESGVPVEHRFLTL